ncbi:hypothetical protein BdWA1_001815 [Babesia duncani]|uniref:Uncharacterized protein n=1 Tax=Babesia duncani TaxID=323732 RepID=A0AAD9UNZ1_9APIC|nr:hypothetical protein BdWA1_001815 [Babesia duncani]
MKHAFKLGTPSNASSEYEDVDFMYEYPDPYASMMNNDEMGNLGIENATQVPSMQATDLKRGGTPLSQHQLTTMKREHYIDNSLRYNIGEKVLFYQLQAELLAHKRRYKEALSAVLVAEELSGTSTVLNAIKMICMYQLNDEAKFKELKEELLNSRFDSLSESLKQQVIGTIQVSNWVPEFLSCLDSMKSRGT